MFRTITISAFSMMMALAGCTSAKKVEAPYTGAAEKVAAASDRQVVTSVEFNKGQRALNPKATEGVERSITTASSQGEIDKVDVIVWSDREYPANGQKLDRVQTDLADGRGESIKNYINRHAPSADVNIVNMAERPSPLAKLFNTEDAEMKRKLTNLGFTPGPNNEFETGRPSSALILIQVK